MPNSSDGGRPPFTDILHTLPSPLIVVLVGLSPAISRLRRTLEVLSWRSSWEDSWLALALWWALCLFTAFVLRYALPLVALASLVLARWRCSRAAKDAPAPPPPATEDTLLQTINDLSTIHALLPSLSFATSITTSATLTPRAVLRTLVLIYIPYLLLTHLVRLRVLVALAGTLLLVHRARWALLIRTSLWRSAYLRRLTYALHARLTGTPQPRVAPSPSPPTPTTALTAAGSAPQPKGDAIRFLFTVYENQRWWVGLDFTAALLPSERPSWSTAPPALLPAPPPAVFALPAPTTVFLPDPASKDAGRIKRTARWRWEEPEWRVVVRAEGGGPGPGTGTGTGQVRTERVERTPPSGADESGVGTTPGGSVGMAAGAAAGRLLNKMRQASLSGSIGSSAASVSVDSDHGHAYDAEHTPRPSDKDKDKEKDKDAKEHSPSRSDGEDEGDRADGEPCTDADGWVYGDNKWEGGSARGGMGKYTRYRRWTRVAVLCEVVERVGPGPLGVARGGGSGAGVLVPEVGSGTEGGGGNGSDNGNGKESGGKKDRARPLSLSTASSPAGGHSSSRSIGGGGGTIISPDALSRPAPLGAVERGVDRDGAGRAQAQTHSRSASSASATTAAEDDRARLRQRLRAAVKGAAGGSSSSSAAGAGAGAGH